MYKLQNVIFEAGIFPITNVQIQCIPFYHSQKEEIIF